MEQKLVLGIMVIVAVLLGGWLGKQFVRRRRMLETSPIGVQSPRNIQFFVDPSQEKQIVEQERQISPNEDEDLPDEYTSLGLELYYKLPGLICIALAAFGRYIFEFHVIDVSFSTNIQYQIFIGMVVLGVWFLGITRVNKRSTDGWVNGMLIFWWILLFT